MTESMRDRLRDELAGRPIGSGYYATAVSVEDAQDMADAVLATFPVLAGVSESMVEAGARALCEVHPIDDGEGRIMSFEAMRGFYRLGARAVLSAAREVRAE